MQICFKRRPTVTTGAAVEKKTKVDTPFRTFKALQIVVFPLFQCPYSDRIRKIFQHVPSFSLGVFFKSSSDGFIAANRTFNP
jgi:hypothetical protein